MVTLVVRDKKVGKIVDDAITILQAVDKARDLQKRVAMLPKAAKKLDSLRIVSARTGRFTKKFDGAAAGVGNAPKTGKYGDLAKDTSVSGQAHHINQNAAYREVIPKNEGMSVKLEGNAFTQPGTPHYEVHAQMETFWNQFRRGGSRVGTMPTNLEYSNAMLKALKESGLSKSQAMQVIKESVKQRIEYGLLGGMEVPRLPVRINQVGR